MSKRPDTGICFCKPLFLLIIIPGSFASPESEPKFSQSASEDRIARYGCNDHTALRRWVNGQNSQQAKKLWTFNIPRRLGVYHREGRWIPHSYRLLPSFDLNNQVHAWDISGDGKMLYILTGTRTVLAVEAKTGKKKWKKKSQRFKWNRADLCIHENKLLVIPTPFGCQTSYLYVLDAETGKDLGRYLLHRLHSFMKWQPSSSSSYRGRTVPVGRGRPFLVTPARKLLFFDSGDGAFYISELEDAVFDGEHAYMVAGGNQLLQIDIGENKRGPLHTFENRVSVIAKVGNIILLCTSGLYRSPGSKILGYDLLRKKSFEFTSTAMRDYDWLEGKSQGNAGSPLKGPLKIFEIKGDKLTLDTGAVYLDMINGKIFNFNSHGDLECYSFFNF